MRFYNHTLPAQAAWTLRSQLSAHAVDAATNFCSPNLARADATRALQPMRLKTLNGAPLREHLDFSESSLLPIVQCTGFSSETALVEDDSTPAIKWRRLDAKDARLGTGWSQPYLPGANGRLDQGEASIFLPDVEEPSTILEPDTTWNDTTMQFDESSAAGDDFLQHSLLFHDTLLSSQVAQDPAHEQTISSSSFMTTSFGTTTSELSSQSRVDGPSLILQVPPKMTVTSLGSFPSVQHLHSIYPQTPTPNVICVAMAAPERREVVVRRGGYKMWIAELIVGDDTRAGFKVTFWLRPPQEATHQPNPQQSLLQTLQSTKTGDILLVRNMALTYYRDTVHGQSLNPAIARARTTIDVLIKTNGVSAAQVHSLPAQLVEAFMRVKRWARSHVAISDGGSRKRSGSATKEQSEKKKHWPSSSNDEFLPPDTMESV